MFKILAMLAASMFGGTLLLSGLRPSPPELIARPPLLLHASGLSDLVAGSDAPVEHWQHVTLVCDYPAEQNHLSANGLNAATASHVLVSRCGRIEIQPAWRRQVAIPGYGRAVVIRIELDRSASRLSPLQRDAIAALLHRFASGLDLADSLVRYESYHPAIPDLSRHLSWLFAVEPGTMVLDG